MKKTLLVFFATLLVAAMMLVSCTGTTSDETENSEKPNEIESENEALLDGSEDTDTDSSESAGETSDETDETVELEPTVNEDGLKFAPTTDGTGYILSSVGSCTDEEVTVPATFNGKPVVAIGDNAFKDCKIIVKIIILGDIKDIGDGAFAACDKLAEITFSGSVKDLGNGAFENCLTLERINFDSELINIGANAFSGCESLLNIALPEGVNSIGDGAFKGCANLESVIIPQSIENVGENIFDGCDALDKIVTGGDALPEGIAPSLPENVETVLGHNDHTWIIVEAQAPDCENNGWDAYQYCDVCGKTDKVTIPALGHTVVIDEAIAPTCTSLGYTEGSHCSVCGEVIVAPTSIKILDHIEVYDAAVDATCTSMGFTEGSHCSMCGGWIVEPQKTDMLDHEYEEMKCIHCGKDQYSVGLYYVLDDNEQGYSVYGIGNCTDTDIVIPPTYNGLPVKAINMYAFAGNETITSVILSENIVEIGIQSFSRCSNLETIYIADSVMYIYDSAFAGSSLKTITFGENSRCDSIGNGAFMNCTSLQSIIIPSNCRSIGEKAFNECTALKSFEVKDNGKLMGIGYRMFYGCVSLESFDFGENSVCWLIDREAFSGCFKLSELKIPDTVTTIRTLAFDRCRSLSEDPFGEKSMCQVIEYGAFLSCSGLTKITIPQRITSLGQDAFNGCFRLVEVYNLSKLDIFDLSKNGDLHFYVKNVYTPTSGKSMLVVAEDYLFYCDETNGECYLLSYLGDANEIVLPDSINGYSYIIHEVAFNGCEWLEGITISQGVSGMAAGCIANCSNLKYIVIEDGGLTAISQSAFSMCYSLEIVTISKDIESMDWGVFYGCTSLKTVNYTGTEAQWSLIKIEDGNDYLLSADKNYNYSSQ